MVAADPGRETRIVEIKERQVVVRQLTDAQFLMLGREARMLQSASVDGQRKIQSAGRILDILESAVVQQEDRDWLMDLVTVGDLELSDMSNVVKAFMEPDKKAAVRRGGRSTSR